MIRKAAIVILILVSPSSNAAELADSLRQHVENYYLAFNENRAEDIDPREFSRGFGFRTYSARSPNNLIPDSIEQWGVRKLMAFFFTQYEYYGTYIDEMNVEVIDDVGIVWGYHIEHFKLKGKPAEKVRVRFSASYKRAGDIWEPLLSHRDIQVFDDQGSYITSEAINE